MSNVSYSSITINDLTEQYTHIRYSASSDGSNLSSTPNKYIGIYVGTSETAPDDKTQYKWSKLVGDTGATGTGISEVSEQYFLTTATTSTGSDSWEWQDYCPEWEDRKYLWKRTKIVYTNPTSVSYTTPYIDTTWRAIDSIEIGGVNLLSFSSLRDEKKPEGRNWEPYALGSVSKIRYTNDGWKYTPDSSSNKYDNSWGILFDLYELGLKPGDKFIISFDIKGTFGDVNSGAILYYATYSTDNSYHNLENFVSIIPSYPKNIYSWERKIAYLAVPDSLTSSSMLLFFGGGHGGHNLEVCVRNVMIERGNKATNWTPKPEDFNESISTAVLSTDVEYYLSSSNAFLTGGSWQTTAPTWVDGKYMWSRTKTVLHNGRTVYRPSENGTCIAGATGATGADGAAGEKGETGTGIASITEEYYLSTSKTEQIGGEWTTAAPTWESGKYIWTRSKIVYTNPSSTKYTTPLCDSSWEAVNEIQVGGRNLFFKSASFNFNQTDHSGNGNRSENQNGIITVTPSVNGNVYLHSADIVTETLLNGCEYTLSFEYISPNALGLYWHPSERYVKDSVLSPTDVWKKYVFTYRQTGVDNSTSKLIGFFNLKAGSIYQFRNFKLEKGNKATDWTPAPEDTISELTEVKKTMSGVSSTVDNVKQQIDNKVWQSDTITVIDSDGNEVSKTLFDAVSQTTQDVNGFKQTVSNTYLKITDEEKHISDLRSEFNQTAEGIEQRVSTNEGNIASLTITSEDINQKVEGAEGDITYLKQTATSLESVVSDKVDSAYVDGKLEDYAPKSVVTQTANSWEARFTTLVSSTTDNADKLSGEVSVRESMIRMEDGKIIIGTVGNEVILVQENNRISFRKGSVTGHELAYFSENKLHVTNGDFIESLQIGSFIYKPRTNGSLDFKKIGG